VIEVGDQVTISTKIYDNSTPPALADPGGISVTVVSEINNVSASPTVVRDGLGLYHAVFTTIALGTHNVTWTTTGVNAGVLADVFEVEQPVFGMVGLTETKNYLRITRANDDEILRGLILTASDLCESPEGTNRIWRRTVVTNELHNGTGCGALTVFKRPIISLTAITVDGVVGSVADYDIEPWRIVSATGAPIGLTSRSSNVSISYVAGGTPVPAGVRDGVLEMVRHLYAMHRGGANLPRQEEPDYTESAGYLIPNRVAVAWRSRQSGF
jgi:uncharacterized phiE125 gp8 family phage protein